jgi:hypothetical protein
MDNPFFWLPGTIRRRAAAVKPELSRLHESDSEFIVPGPITTVRPQTHENKLYHVTAITAYRSSGFDPESKCLWPGRDPRRTREGVEDRRQETRRHLKGYSRHSAKTIAR